jgi:hypothetical protein
MLKWQGVSAILTALKDSKLLSMFFSVRYEMTLSRGTE